MQKQILKIYPMKLMRSSTLPWRGFHWGFLLVVFLLLPNFARAAIFFEDNFDGYADSPANHGWGIPSAATLENSDSPDGGRALKFSILSAGTAQYWSNFDPNPNGEFSNGYIAFWAKQTGHTNGTYGGNKWLKLFSADYGGPVPESYANVTFGQNYLTGEFYGFGTGNGFDLSNDTQAAYRYNGMVGGGSWSAGTTYAAGTQVGYHTDRIYLCKTNHVAALDNQPGVGDNWQTYWDIVGTISNFSASFYPGEGWHFYEYYVKHNTDNNFDGEMAVWVDGQLKIRVINMRNRNNANAMDWDSASLVNHVQDPYVPANEYQIYFDAIKTADAYIEYPGLGGDMTAPSAPSGLSVR